MSLSFATVLTKLASNVQCALDETTGLPTPKRQEEHRWTQFLNEAAQWIWRGKYQNYTIPDLITGTSATLTTGGIITAATLDSSDFWSVWTSDPRLAQPEDRARLALRAIAKPNGDLLVENGTSGDTVYLIYRLRIPKWTAVLASDFGSTVSLDTRLWNKECGDDGDGHVYRALAASVSPDDFTVTANWLPVTLPETLLEPITAKALAIKARADGQFDIATAWEDQAERWMETRAVAAEQQPGEKPWLYNQNV
jgi:hypothetical protein